MSDTRLISILLPFYNEENYIRQCLRSIQEQSYTNWELIAIDDQSTDGSPAIVKDMQEQDSRIRYLLNPEKGVIKALSNGFKESRGELITRMDADDYKTSDNLMELAGLVSAEGTIATGMVKYFSDEADGLQGGYARYEKWINNVIKDEACFSHVYKECTIPSPCWMVGRADLIKAGAFNSELYPEDYDLNLRFHKAGLKVRAVKKVIHYWRDHNRRVTRNDHRYRDNFFIDLKLPYFIDNEYDASSFIVLWGAGKKAKEVAKRLVDREIPFQWISNNERKLGLDIYGVRLIDQKDYVFAPNHKIIIAISSPPDQKTIQEILDKWNLSAGINYWWFC